MKKMMMVVMMVFTLVAGATNAFAYDIPAEGVSGSYERSFDSKGREVIKTTWKDENGVIHTQTTIIDRSGFFDRVITITS